MSNKNKLDYLKLDNEKLSQTILEKKKDLISLRFKQKLGELNDTSNFKAARKDIARLFTELKKRKNSK